MIIKEAVDLIKSFESFSSKIYLCPNGFKTIGYGHLVQKHENFSKGINHQEAIDLFMLDINIAICSVFKNINILLNPFQIGALTSFVFNLGGAALQRSTLRQKINNHEHDLVVNEFRKWIFVSGKKLPGLIRRREAEAALYYKGFN